VSPGPFTSTIKPSGLSSQDIAYIKMADRVPPTPVAMLIGTAILSLATGYMIGMASSLGFLPNPFSPSSSTGLKTKTSGYDDEEESSESDIDIDDGTPMDHAPNWANGEEADKRDGLRASAKKVHEKPVARDGWNANEECKLVLVVRTDLGMTKGTVYLPASN
jgi:PTH2 family peptidyl-tRNA hydrolase